jgi:GNAT superfamily N-acetyltransferase
MAPAPFGARPSATTVRPARVADLPVLADLLVQLYAAELPGALTGAPAAQRRLLHFTLAAQPTQALQQRYVLCDAAAHVVATGMLQFPTQPPFDRAPAGTLRLATRLLGYRAAGHLLLTVARSQVGVAHPPLREAVLVHSVVVDARRRGQGLGHTLMEALEQQAREHGAEWAVLQVLAANVAARRFYLQRGYEEVWRTPRWRAALSWPSYVMRKALPHAPGPAGRA